MDKKKVVVIGAGFGGLGSAILLARAGYDVTVVEKNDKVGGRANLLELDGYKRDMGPSWYLMPDAFDRYFTAIGRKVSDYLDLQKLEPSYRVFFKSAKGEKLKAKGYEILPHNDKLPIENKTSNLVIASDSVAIQGEKEGITLEEKVALFGKVFSGAPWFTTTTHDQNKRIITAISDQCGFVQGHAFMDDKYVGGYYGCKLSGVPFEFENKITAEEFAIKCSKICEDFDPLTTWNLRNCYVDYDCQNKGIGTKLLGHFEEEVIKRGGIFSVLSTHISGFQRNRYEKNGYITFWEIENFGHKLVFMIKRLDCFVPRNDENNVQGATYLDLYADVDKAATTFEGIESGSGDKLRDYLKSAAYQYGIAMEKFVFKNFDSIWDFMTPQLAIEGMQLNVFTKLYNYVSRFVKNENLKKLLMYPSVFLGTSPYETPALFNIMSHVDFNQGVFYPQGGIFEIPKALHQIALEEGVKFEFNAEIEKIVVEDKKVIGAQFKNHTLNYDLSDQYIIKNPYRDDELFLKLKEFTDKTFEGKPIQQRHFQRTVDRVLYQDPSADLAMILAGYGHDIERGFRDPLKAIPENYTDPAFLKNHQESGATIIKDFLLKNGADQQLADKVRHLISKHEEGGDTEQDILRDADSASYFETAIETFVQRAHQGIGTQESIIDKVNRMYQKIESLKIKDIIKGNYEKSIGEIKQSKNNQISADIIISNADMRHTETQLLEPSQQTYPESYWAKQVISPSGFILYLGVDGELPQLKHHTLVFSNDWRGGFDQIFKDPQRPQDPNYYICNPSKTDPSVAPAGKENLFVLVPIAPGLESTPQSLEAYRDHIIADIAHNCGISDLQDRIEVSQIFSIPQFEQYYNAYKGTALGLAHTFFQSAVRRPQNYSKKVKGLYYAGGYTTPGIGMPMCLISAMMVADRVEKK